MSPAFWSLLGLLCVEVQPGPPTLNSVPGDRHSTPPEGVVVWRPLAPGAPPERLPVALPEQNSGSSVGGRPSRRGARLRRHDNHGRGRGRAQLMRAGCVLGTCQVQNLSHRLYQLIGHRGRDDSAPVSPLSPHSYG